MKQRTSLKARFALLMLTVGSIAQAEPSGSPSNAWNFDVFLNDKKVGTHLFEVTDNGGQKRVQSVANFKVKILFISAYSYEHTNIESWADDCLLEFKAETAVNGKQSQVSGVSSDTGFTVQREAVRQVLPSCIMSFAYWNPAFLKQDRLLNPQTGEFLDVDVESLGSEVLSVRGQRVAAERFKVTARGIDLLLWYSTNAEWLRLESVAKGGHTIRYELS